MNPRNTILMFLVVLGLGGFWYFHDVKGGQKREEAKEKEARLFPGLEKDAISTIRLVDTKEGGKPPVVLQKVDGRWLVGEKGEYLAMQGEVNGLADQLATLRRESVIAETPAPASLKEYGLETPRYRLELGLNDRSPARTLLLGDKTPDESGYYARSGDQGPVLEVASMFMGTLEKPAAELREKSPLPLDPVDVTRLAVKPASGPAVELVKETKSEDAAETQGVEALTDRWQLEAPEKTAADASKVQDWLWAWKSLSAGRFLAEDEKADFGTTALRLELWSKDAKAPQVVEVGSPVAVKPGMYYVRRLDPPEMMVVELGPKEKDLLDATLATFEDRHLLAFAEDEADRLTLTVGDQELDANRIRDGWDVKKPADVVKDESARNSAVADLLYEAKDLQWEAKGGEGAPTRVDAPRARLTVSRKGGEAVGTLLLGPTAPGGGAWVQRDGAATVYKVAKDPLGKWQEILGRLREKPAGAGSPSPAAPASPHPPDDGHGH